MAVVFAVRGDSKDARYSSYGKTPVTIAPVPANAPVVAASAISGVIGGNVIRHDVGGLAIQYLEWPGRTNIPQKAFSVLLRCTFTQNTGLIGLWSWSSGAQGTLYRVTLYYNAGTLNFRYYDEASNIDLNISGSWTPTVDTIYDVVAQWDGLTTSNGAKVYVDNTLIVQGTAGAASVSDMRLTTSTLYLGASAYDVQNSRIKVNEFVVFDTVISTSSVTLSDDSSGALNGASRTLFVKADSFDGQSNSAPSASDVKTGTSYTVAGTSYTGTYTGSDRWTDPGEANVAYGVEYKANSTTNNKTGTYNLNPELSAKVNKIFNIILSK